MPKSNKSDKQKEKLSKNENQENNIINSPLISLEKINFQENTSYNPFASQENKPNENSEKDLIKENDNNSSPLEEKEIKEIIDINTPSNSHRSDNLENGEGEDWNSSKEKLKKDLLEKNNNNNTKWGGESPGEKSDKINSDNDWGKNNSSGWGSNSIDNKDNNMEKNNKKNNIKDKMDGWGSDENNNNDEKKY